jgi:hypothetical protein
MAPISKAKYEKRQLLYRYGWTLKGIAEELGLTQGQVKAGILEGEKEDQDCVYIARARLFSYLGVSDEFMDAVTYGKLGHDHARKMRYTVLEKDIGDVGVYVIYARIVKDVYGKFLEDVVYRATTKPEGGIYLTNVNNNVETSITHRKAKNNFVVVSVDPYSLSGDAIDVRYWVPDLDDFVMDVPKYVELVRKHINGRAK